MGRAPLSQASSPFVEVECSKLANCDVEGYGRKMAKSVHIVCSDKRIVIRLDDLSKLLSLLEMTPPLSRGFLCWGLGC